MLSNSKIFWSWAFMRCFPVEYFHFLLVPFISGIDFLCLAVWGNVGQFLFPLGCLHWIWSKHKYCTNSADFPLLCLDFFKSAKSVTSICILERPLIFFSVPWVVENKTKQTNKTDMYWVLFSCIKSALWKKHKFQTNASRLVLRLTSILPYSTSQCWLQFTGWY